uniref:Putative secreted protein n=1 Tax=Nyssomyia neivai TaxID=330878 RepID=A0A1L8DNJ6_9DIPT
MVVTDLAAMLLLNAQIMAQVMVAPTVDGPIRVSIDPKHLNGNLYLTNSLSKKRNFMKFILVLSLGELCVSCVF